MKSMKKKVAIFFAVIILILCLLPVPLYLKDGGTVVYQAVLYRITDYHSMREEGTLVGTQVKVLGVTVYENVIVAEE